MRNKLNSFIAFFLLLLSTNAFAQQKDYSTVHLIVGRGMMGISYSVSVYINDYLVTNINSYEALNIKYYSKGRTSVTLLYSNAKFSGSVDITENKDYYLIQEPFAMNQNVQVVDFARWDVFNKKAKQQIEIEEDLSKPWGKIGDNPKSGKGQGTCFAISSNGYLVTNFHCIDNAKEITVKGIDGDLTTKYGATVVASDPSNDLALIKIGNKNVKFNVPSFGFRSSGVAQAERVYAIGFPAAAAMGTEVKITEGIISAKSGVGGDISKFQISAAVNPGNSGGPLIDEQGNLIGVIFAKSTIAESAGYAIKASYLETFLKNVDGFEFPTFVNNMKDKSLPEKVADWKNYIFIVETN